MHPPKTNTTVCAISLPLFVYSPHGDGKPHRHTHTHFPIVSPPPPPPRHTLHIRLSHFSPLYARLLCLPCHSSPLLPLLLLFSFSFFLWIVFFKKNIICSPLLFDGFFFLSSLGENSLKTQISAHPHIHRR
ncbi:hypothetical protein, unlikely [Trypanosoma congolense IL3000]|uniref:Uncharacterized protein n=1 Tax=Trypanosoma congolense (strain IL3000) TaxID=1068625 RepID=F9W572_TRYCI|nr:hypothetical protein, unlikely [Trypanosoma congolense IL3000]